MNILYLTITGETVGGAEISLFNLLENLDRNKFSPYVLMPFEGDYTQKISQLNIPVFILPFKKAKNPFNIVHSFKTLRRLIKIIKRYKIDIIHSNTQSGGVAFFGGLAGRSTKVPFIWHPRIISSGGIWDAIQYFFCTKIIVISEAAKKRFWWVPDKRKMIRVYNGVNLDRFNVSLDIKPFRQEAGCKEDEFLVGAVGVPHPRKKYEYFIKAAQLVTQKVPNTKFLIVGFEDFHRDRYLNDLLHLTKKLNLADKVIFMEKRADILQVFASLDVFVLSSLAEPFGRVLIEAMACAKPVVAFGGGGVPEIVQDEKTGFLVAPKDFKGLADRIIYLLKNKNIRDNFGLEGRRRVERLFDIKDHAHRIESLYSELSGRKRESKGKS